MLSVGPALHIDIKKNKKSVHTNTYIVHGRFWTLSCVDTYCFCPSLHDGEVLEISCGCSCGWDSFKELSAMAEERSPFNDRIKSGAALLSCCKEVPGLAERTLLTWSTVLSSNVVPSTVSMAAIPRTPRNSSVLLLAIKSGWWTEEVEWSGRDGECGGGVKKSPQKKRGVSSRLGSEIAKKGSHKTQWEFFKNGFYCVFPLCFFHCVFGHTVNVIPSCYRQGYMLCWADN